MEKISDILNLTEMKKKSLHKSFLMLLLEWKYFENHLDLTQKCFKESYKELKSRENHLHEVQESVTQSSNELDLIRKSLEKRFQQLEQKENEFHLFQENGIRELDLKEEKLGLIVKDVKLREERMDLQEKLMKKLLVEIKTEREGFERVRKKVDDGVKEMMVKQKFIEDRFREHELKVKASAECVKEEQFKEKKLNVIKKEIGMSKKDPSCIKESKPIIDYEMADESNSNIVDISSGSESAGNKCSRKKRLPSIAWKHFTKLVKEDGTTSDQCKCNYCDKIFPCSSRLHGTSSLLNHISGGKCPVYQGRIKGLQTTDVQDVQDEELPVKRGDTRNAKQFGFNTRLSDQKLHQNDQPDPSVDQRFKMSRTAAYEQTDGSKEGTIDGRRHKSSRLLTTCNSQSQGSADAGIGLGNAHSSGRGTRIKRCKEKYDGNENSSDDSRQMIIFEAEKQRNAGDLGCKSRKRRRKHVVVSDESSDTSNLSVTEYFVGCSRRLRDISSRESYEKHKIDLYNDDPMFGFIICSPPE